MGWTIGPKEGWRTEVQKGAGTLVSADEIAGSDEIEFAWYPYFVIGSLNMVSGEQEAGKSAIALHIAHCATAGLPMWDKTIWPTPQELWKDQSTPADDALALWFEYEFGDHMHKVRAQDIGMDLERLVFGVKLDAILNEGPDLGNEDAADQIIRMIEAAKPVVVVVDALSTAHAEDENSAKVRGVVAAMALVARSVPCPVILIHHLRKSGHAGRSKNPIDEIRGHSSQTQPIRSILGISWPDKGAPGRLITHIKSSSAKKGDDFGVDIEGGIDRSDPLSMQWSKTAPYKKGKPTHADETYRLLQKFTEQGSVYGYSQLRDMVKNSMHVSNDGFGKGLDRLLSEKLVAKVDVDGREQYQF